jgi:AcrR family transcriptional regulator
MSGGLRHSDSPASARRRQAIIDAANEVLRERDVGKVAIADIAEVAGVSVATVYNLIGTRERVLAAVLDGYVARLTDELAHYEPPQNAADAVIEVVRLATVQTLADPQPIRAVLCELGALSFGDHQQLGMASLFEPLLAGLGPAAPGTDLIVYGYRGVLLSWAHGLISDHAFAADAERMTRQLLGSASPAPTTKEWKT